MMETKKKIKAPNKKIYEDEMNILVESIKGKEKELKTLGRLHVDSNNEDTDILQKESKKVRAEKETAFENRKRLDEELKSLRDNISKKQDMLTRMQGVLPYTTESRIDEAVQKLQYQLNTQCFKLREEKRVVAEIDSLKRSKKSVREYLDLKRELEGDRTKQKEMKDEKDLYYKSVHTLKTKEEEIKQKLEAVKKNTEISKIKLKENEIKRTELKKEIDAMYDKKRSMVVDYKQQYKIYQNHLKRQRADSFKRREEDRRALKLAKQKEIEEYEASKKPYEDQLLLCSTLITYLGRFVNHPEMDSVPSTQPDLQAAGEASVAAPTPEGVAKVLIKSKTIEDVKVHKKRKKEKRRSTWAGKAIKHNPEVFAQFSSLDLNAPSTVGEVNSILKSLQDKKKNFEELAIAISTTKAIGANSTEEIANETEEVTSTSSIPHALGNLNLKMTEGENLPPTLNATNLPTPAASFTLLTTHSDLSGDDLDGDIIDPAPPPQTYSIGPDSLSNRSHNGGECNGNVLDDFESDSSEVSQTKRPAANQLINSFASAKLKGGLAENAEKHPPLHANVDPNQNGVFVETFR